MPLSPSEACCLYDTSTKIQACGSMPPRSGCTFPAAFCYLRVNYDHGSQELYVGIYTSAIRFPDEHLLRVRCHITVLKIKKCRRDLDMSILQNYEPRAQQLMEQHPICIARAGDDLVFAGPDSDPHRIILTIHVQSSLHAELFNVRRDLLRDIRPISIGKEKWRRNFHLSLDYVEQEPSQPLNAPSASEEMQEVPLASEDMVQNAAGASAARTPLQPTLVPIASEEVQEVPHPSEDSVQGIVGAHPVESGATSEASPNVWVGRGTKRRHLFDLDTMD